MVAGVLMLVGTQAPWATLAGKAVPFGTMTWNGFGGGSGIMELRVNDALVWTAPAFGMLVYALSAVGLVMLLLGILRAFRLGPTWSRTGKILATLLDLVAVIAVVLAVLRVHGWIAESHERVKPGALTASFGIGIGILCVAALLGLVGSFLWPSDRPA